MKKKKFAICIALLISVFTLVGSFACCLNGNTGDNNTGDNGQEDGDNSRTEIDGEFYTLLDAYDNGFLTREDLQTIAYYHHNKNVPYPESLDEDIAAAIKRTWVEDYYKNNTVQDGTEIEAHIYKYYGEFNGCYTGIIDRKDATYLGVSAPYEVEVGGVIFNFDLYRPVITVFKITNQEPPETPTIVPKNCEALVEATLSGAISTHSDFMAICYSLEQLNEECISNGYDFFDSENSMQNDYDTAAGEKIRALKPEDFEGKAFVLCAFYRSEYPGQYRIEEAEVTEDKLTLYVRFPYRGYAFSVVNYVFLIATVEESSVSSVADLTYVIRYE